MYKQQGDVLFFRVDSIPNKATLYKNGNRIIVAEGEATGHSHKIVDQCEAYTLEQELFIKANKPVRVLHEEHNTIVLDVGTWRVAKVREYDHFLEESREVID